MPPVAPPLHTAASPSVLVGTVERVTYHNAETGYTVARVHVTGETDSTVVIGHFSSVTPGETLRMAGFWVTHRQYGPQFKVANYEVCKPATLAGIEKYLGSGLIKGVGPVTAKRIVAHFKDATLDIIENAVERLREVPSIGEKRVEMIARAWAEQQAVKEVMLFLQSHGVTTHYAVKIFKEYGARAVQTVSENPYRLAKDIYGIGFKTADKIAANLGIKPDSEERIRAGLAHTLGVATENGHCYLPAPELAAETRVLLGLSEDDAIRRIAARMAVEQELLAFDVAEERPVPNPSDRLEDDRIASVAYYLPPLWHFEQNVAKYVRGLTARPVACGEAQVLTWLEHFARKERLELSDEQRRAVVTAATQRVMILTGGPGCGKTTTLRALVKLFHAFGKTVELASPTGRAAQRLSEVSGVEARTIHRLLAYDPAQRAFTRNADFPLDADVVIVDEASMLDIALASHLLKAVPADGQLVLVGDADQLPSVGPGRVLADLIDSQAVPVIRLTQVFRQAQGSFIITNAHRIRDGEFPRLIEPDGMTNTDCYFLKAEEPEDVHRLLVNAVTRSLPKRFRCNPLTDIQVLTPMNRGSIGAGELNRLLQTHLNPPTPGKEQIERMGRIFREGDKVIQKVNNYTLEVFNGDVGTIVGINLEEQTATIDYAGRRVVYDWSDLNELGHGFAISVHKSQGSEYPIVVVVMHAQAWPVLSRNLIYTALTRAKRTAVIVGNARAIGAAMKRTEAGARNTRLAHALNAAIH
jgi:exodeoxyribonuclease V alpha subunit